MGLRAMVLDMAISLLAAHIPTQGFLCALQPAFDLWPNSEFHSPIASLWDPEDGGKVSHCDLSTVPSCLHNETPLLSTLTHTTK